MDQRDDGQSAEPATGDSRVDEALSRLGDLAGLPVAEHPAVFEDVHQRLAAVLGDLEPGSQAPGRTAEPGDPQAAAAPAEPGAAGPDRPGGPGDAGSGTPAGPAS